MPTPLDKTKLIKLMVTLEVTTRPELMVKVLVKVSIKAKSLQVVKLLIL